MLIKNSKRLLQEVIGHTKGGIVEFLSSTEFEGLPVEKIYARHKFPYPKFTIKPILNLPDTIVIVSESLKNNTIQLPRVNVSHEYILAEFKLESDLAVNSSDLAEYLKGLLDWYERRGKIKLYGWKKYYPFIPVYMCDGFMVCKFINNLGYSVFNFSNIHKEGHCEKVFIDYMLGIGYSPFNQQN